MIGEDQADRIQIGKKRRSRRGVNIAPLIDIVFLLLVFFMLTTSFLERQAVNLDIPAPTSATAVLPEDSPMIIRVSAQGEWRDMDGRVLSPTALGSLAIETLASEPERAFHVQSDWAAPVQATLDAIDVLRGAGVDNPQFSTRPEERS